MRRRLSVIIPALNEESTIAEAVGSARDGGAAEIIVADAGSSDRTREVAEAAGAVVLRCDRLRGRQLNRGAETASGDAFLFLHADSILPAGGADAIFDAMERGFGFGGFQLAFSEADWRLRTAERMINFRTRMTRCPWGDQGQFITRELFLRSGGFREFPFLEDYEFAVRMRRNCRAIILPLRVITSGRRFLRKGVLRTAMINWTLIGLYRVGVSPATLAKLYR